MSHAIRWPWSFWDSGVIIFSFWQYPALQILQAFSKMLFPFACRLLLLYLYFFYLLLVVAACSCAATNSCPMQTFWEEIYARHIEQNYGSLAYCHYQPPTFLKSPAGRGWFIQFPSRVRVLFMPRQAPLSDLIASSQTRKENFINSNISRLQNVLKTAEMPMVRIIWCTDATDFQPLHFDLAVLLLTLLLVFTYCIANIDQIWSFLVPDPRSWVY